MYRLQLLGGASFEDPSVPVSGRVGHRHRLALLALLAGAGAKGCSRDKLIAYLWPESDTSHARHRLSDSLYVLRQALGKDPVVVDGEHMWLNREAVWVDAMAFQEALESGDQEAAVGLYGGPFLEGFHLGGSREFEDWLQSERARLADLHAKALESLARQAEGAGDPARAADWWKRLLATDPYSSPVALRLMEALAAAGDPANAIQQAHAHERLLRDELDMEPPAEIRALVERLRAEPLPAARAAEAPSIAGEPEVVRGVSRRRNARTRTAVILAGVVIISLLSFASAYVLSRDRAGGIVGRATAEPAPAVAVLPFTVRGPGMELWREGLVDLLSVNLDGPALRAIDSRTVLARWREQVGEAMEPDLETALEVARATEARHAVIGTAVSSGRDVRLTADIVDLQTGERVRQAHVDGPADSMIALIDRLSIQLLRSLLKGRVAGSVDLASHTTRSVEGLKAFLAGEQLYRRGQYESAGEAYARAVAADSQFALALYRLGLSRGWFDIATFGREELERAEALSSALPRREAALLRGDLALVTFDAGWIDSARVLADRYPDDAEAWVLLGELYYHRGARRHFGYEEAERAFQRAVQLDPNCAPFNLHLVDLAFVHQADSALAAERIAHYRALAPDSPKNEEFQLTFQIAFGDEEARQAALAKLQAGELADLVSVEYRLRHPRFWTRREPLVLLELRMGPDEVQRSAARDLFLSSLYQRGRLARALAYLDDPVVDRAIGPCHLMAAEVNVGALPERRLERALGREAIEHAIAEGALTLEERAQTVACGAMYAARLGRENDYRDLRQRLGALAAAAEAEGDSALAQKVRDRTRYTDGVREWLLGNPEAAYQALVDFPAMLDYMLANWWGRILLDSRRPELAIPYFIGERTDPLAHLYLGKAYEALGRDAEARAAYQYFLLWWAAADPEFRPLLDDARRALTRIGQRLN